MYRAELPEIHTISPDPVLYVKGHNHGITYSTNFSVSTKLAFYLLRRCLPTVWLSVIRITRCCDIDVLVHKHCGLNTYGGRVTSNGAEKVRYEEEFVPWFLYVEKKGSSLCVLRN